MIHQEKILAIIPARAGSKGLKGKNTMLLAGKPLIAWTIDAALSSGYLDTILVSTDDHEIAETAKRYGAEVPFIRADVLAQDDTTTIDVVLDVLQRCNGHDWVALLQPTSPLRTAADIDGAIEYCIQHKAESCASVALAQESPYWMYTLDSQDHMIPHEDKIISQRQKLPQMYSLNGAFYLARTEQLLAQKKFITEDTIGYVMPLERSIDIDTLHDFRLVELIINGELKW